MTNFAQAAADQAAANTPPAQETFQEAASTHAPTPQIATPLDNGAIVVGGKMYHPEAAAKKIENADTHITTLERENAEKDATTLKLLERIEALEKDRNTTDAIDRLVAAQPIVPATPAPEPLPTQEVSKEELVQAAVDSIKGEQVAQKQSANLDACIAEAQTAFGDDYGVKVDAAGAKHGMNFDQIMEMARNQPSVFKALFIPEGAAAGKPDTTRSSTIGGLGQEGFAPPAKRKSYLNMSAKERNAEITRRMNALSNPG